MNQLRGNINDIGLLFTVVVGYLQSHGLEEMHIRYSGYNDSGNDLEWGEGTGALTPEQRKIVDDLAWELIEHVGADFNNEGSQGWIVFTKTSLHVDHQDNLEQREEWTTEGEVPEDARERYAIVGYEKEYKNDDGEPTMDSVYNYEKGYKEWSEDMRKDGWTPVYNVVKEEINMDRRRVVFIGEVDPLRIELEHPSGEH